MKDEIKKGTASKLMRVFIQDSSSATGAGLAGLTNASAGLTWYYCREGDAATTAVTLVAGTLGTWASGGFVAVDATHMPGVYELGIPNAVLASGANSVVMFLQGATNMAPLPIEIKLVDYDPNNGVNLSLTALPTAALNSGANSFNLDASGFVKSDPQTSVTVSSIGANVITAASIAAGALNGKGDWLLATNYTTPPSTAAITQAVWQDLTSSADFTTAGSIGKLLVTDIDAAISTRLPTSSYTAPPTTAAISTAILTDTTAGDLATVGSLGYIIGHAPTWYTAAPTAAQVATAVWTDLLASADFSTASSIGALLKTDIDAAISSRLASSSYAAPPSAATIATTVWQDLLAGADFGTAGSVGNLLKTDIDAAISSRLASSSYTAPPTAAAIATAVLTDTTDLTTAGSIGYILAHNFAGMLTTATSSVFTAAALANAPTGGAGGSVTVAGYAAGQDPATLVLGATATSWNAAGSIGQKINSAASAGDPLTNNVPGNYASGTAGYALGRLGSGQIVTNSIVAQGGSFTILRGDTYYAADGRALLWTDSNNVWPDLTGATITMDMIGSPSDWTHPVTAVIATGNGKQVQMELSDIDTNAIPGGRFRIKAVLTSGHTLTLVDNVCQVNDR